MSVSVGDTLLLVTSGPWVPPAAPTRVGPSLPPVGSLIWGFPVQIYRSLGLVDAESRRAEAERLLGRSVTVESRAPYYRVLVGNARTRAEAESLRQELLRQGFEGATVVEGLVSPE